MSDNTAADALFDLVPPAEVDQALRQAGIGSITIRHRMRELTQTPAELFGHAGQHLAHSLAIGSQTPGRGHMVPQLDITRANSGTARAFTDLLHALWVPSRLPAEVAARVRALMAENVVRHRLAPDFSSDSSIWSSKTGTLLNLRHEVGVVEHDDGSAYANRGFHGVPDPGGGPAGGRSRYGPGGARTARILATLTDMLKEHRNRYF